MESREDKIGKVQSLVHTMWTVLRDEQRKKEEACEAQRASMTEKDLDKQMEESWKELQSMVRRPNLVDMVGIELKWTPEEQKLVSLQEDHKWNLFSLLLFVWTHLMKNQRGMDDDTFEKEFAEVNRLVKVIHHKMRTKDTRLICIVPTWMDRETRFHFMTNDDISAVQKAPFTVLDRPALPPYDSSDKGLDVSSVSFSSSNGETTDDSFY